MNSTTQARGLSGSGRNALILKAVEPPVIVKEPAKVSFTEREVRLIRDIANGDYLNDRGSTCDSVRRKIASATGWDMARRAGTMRICRFAYSQGLVKL